MVFSQFEFHVVPLGPFYPQCPLLLSSLSCCNPITRPLQSLRISSLVGELPFSPPIRADVTFEQHLLSDKLEDGRSSLSLSQWKWITHATAGTVIKLL